tara:strand:+ start:382 stop:804 length:423 start_codon:yes stop_codon:yes gene_type:complete
MIAIIRIKGMVKIKQEIEETLSRLRLRRKYACVIIDEKDKIRKGMLKKVENLVAFGEIDKQMLVRLIEKRGQLLEKDKKIDAEKIASELQSGKDPKDLGIKPFFRLHPPRGGLKSSKKHFPKGVIGNNKEAINKLIERML